MEQHKKDKVVVMATKSFTSDFKLNKKSSDKLARALNGSRKVEHQINQQVKTVRDIKTINDIMSTVIRKQEDR